MQTGNESHRLDSRLTRLLWVQVFISFGLLLIATILGAFFAHSLEGKISDSSMEVFATGNRYHFYFSLAMLAGGLAWKSGGHKLFLTGNWCFLAGILLFSGSLYFLAIKSLLSFNISWMGPVTPFGGLFFMLGCVLYLAGSYKLLKR